MIFVYSVVILPPRGTNLPSNFCKDIFLTRECAQQYAIAYTQPWRFEFLIHPQVLHFHGIDPERGRLALGYLTGEFAPEAALPVGNQDHDDAHEQQVLEASDEEEDLTGDDEERDGNESAEDNQSQPATVTVYRIIVACYYEETDENGNKNSIMLHSHIEEKAYFASRVEANAYVGRVIAYNNCMPNKEDSIDEHGCSTKSFYTDDNCEPMPSPPDGESERGKPKGYRIFMAKAVPIIKELLYAEDIERLLGHRRGLREPITVVSKKLDGFKNIEFSIA